MVATKEWMSNAGYEIYTKYVQPLEDEIACLKGLLEEIGDLPEGLVVMDAEKATHPCGQCMKARLIAARAKKPPNDQ